MAYRNPLFGKWPPFFTDNDLNALVQIWGAEQSLPVALDGLALSSLGGRNDAFHGQRVAAHLNGNAGRDVLSGGVEGDVLRGGKDADSLSGFAGDDWLSAIWVMMSSMVARVPTISTEASVMMRCGVTRARMFFVCRLAQI